MVHEGPNNFSGLRRGLSLQKFYVLITTNPFGIKYEPRSQCCCLLITGKIPVKEDLELQIIFRIFIYNAGGGWTLVVSISFTNNQHLQRAAVNCFDLELCVPFDKQSMTTRKLSDEHIHHLANSEGTTQDAQICPLCVLSHYLFKSILSTCHKIYIAAHYRKLGKI